MTLQSKETEDNTIMEDLRESFIEHEADEDGDTPVLSHRDENGRFKQKADKAEVEAEPKEPVTTAEPAAQTETEQAGTWTHKRPPSSWTPKAREDWDKIPEHLQKEITRREEAQAMGARLLHEQYSRPKALLEALHDPLMEAIGPHGDPVQHIGLMMTAEKILRTAPMPQKFKQLMAMADQFGIPLRDIINASVGEEVLQRPNASQSAIPDAVARELAEIRQWRESTEQQVVDREVHQYGQSLEFFEDVRDYMADLIEKGLAKDLPSAYELATWANPHVREVLLERQGKASASNSVATRQARAAGASVKPSGGVPVPIDADDESDSIADTVRKSMQSAQGRV